MKILDKNCKNRTVLFPPDQNACENSEKPSSGGLPPFYGDYLSSHKGKAPKGNADFHKYLESRAEDLRLYNVESPDQLHDSPRDNRPLAIVSGQVILPPDSPNTPWAAFEQKGLDDKRYGVRVRGGIHELTTEEIDQIFMGAQK